MRTPHTSVKRGKKVRIKLRNGEIIIDKFIDRNGKFIILEKYGKIKPKEIASFGIYRENELDSNIESGGLNGE